MLESNKIICALDFDNLSNAVNFINIINTQNRFVYSILEMTYRLTEPMLNKIRRFLPNLGSLDISPVILLLLIWFIEMCMKLYIAPMIL